MIDERPWHPSDEDIDAFWKDILDAGDEEGIEQHLLECDDCHRRTRAVEDLRDGLQILSGDVGGAASVRTWQVAAAVVAAVGLLAGWQWARASAELRRVRAELERRPAMTAAVQSSNTAILTVALAPPTRDAQTHVVTLGTAGVVIFELDAREAGRPGARFDLTLSDPSGTRLQQVMGILSSPDGALRLIVDTTLLQPGPHLIEIHADGVSVGFPLLIQR